MLPRLLCPIVLRSIRSPATLSPLTRLLARSLSSASPPQSQQDVPLAASSEGEGQENLSSEELSKQSVEFWKKGEYPQALDAMRRAYINSFSPEGNPDDTILNNLFSMSFAMGEFELAIRLMSDFTDVYELKKSQGECTKEDHLAIVPFYINRGRSFHRARYLDQAVEDFIKITEIDPKNVFGHQYLGYTYLDIYESSQRDEDILNKALDSFNLANNLSPNTPGLLYGTGLTRLYMGQSEEALDLFNKTLEADPEFDSVYLKIADCYAVRGEHQKVNEYCGKYIEKNRDSIAESEKDLRKLDFELLSKFCEGLFKRATSNVQLQQYDKAIEDYSELIDLSAKYDPQVVDEVIFNLDYTYHYRARVWAFKGEFEKAIEDDTKAIEKNAQLIEAYASRAQSYQKIGKSEEAKKDAETFAKLRAQQQQAAFDQSQDQVSEAV